MRTRDAIRMAKRDGADAGRAAASWYFDGNTKDETYAAVLKGIEDGDPAILDTFPTPNLSGEWAGDATPQSLAEDYGIEGREDAIDAVCSAWEDAAWSAVQDEIERAARYQVKA